MNYRLCYPSEYLAAVDLMEKGEVNVTIESLTQEEIKAEGRCDKKWVMRFRGAHKRLVMNKTNLKRIARALGSCETNDWIGKTITLHPDKCNAFGETVDCIRVK